MAMLDSGWCKYNEDGEDMLLSCFSYSRELRVGQETSGKAQPGSGVLRQLGAL